MTKDIYRFYAAAWEESPTANPWGPCQIVNLPDHGNTSSIVRISQGANKPPQEILRKVYPWAPHRGLFIWDIRLPGPLTLDVIDPLGNLAKYGRDEGAKK